MKQNIYALQHVSFIIKDIPQSLSFYCDLLQMKQNLLRPDLGYAGVWIDINEQQQIHLLALPNPDPIDNRPTHGGHDRHTALMVEDLQLIVDKLKHARISFTLSKSGRRALFCRDPDNNTLEFIEIVSASCS